ncbi:LTA synthase family protein [Idiomarina xiamenensis]|uniref:Phosphoglycerol transferase I n=1 Tax=Idiomarina xiamenensis 10-D-4 TaxID=740709 RepID=K2K375_9GAMM|nr:LTA synthase family protein [Idiomarina xiamenensis]EKE82073.1 phosphoglycerol transferase I [Idiomarina xiamenensis 10-D-4]
MRLLVFRFYRPLGLFFLTLFGVFLVSRLALMGWLMPRIAANDFASIVAGGVRIDLSTCAYLSLPLLLLMLLQGLLPQRCARLVAYLVKAYAVLVVTLAVLMELATPAFIQQYDVRPNRLFIEYLTYPREVTSMLLSGHLLTTLSSLLLSVICFCLLLRFWPRSSVAPVGSRTTATAVALVLLIGLAGLARGTLEHRPLNPALVYFSDDALVNSLALNSPYSVAFAIKNMTNERSAKALYGDLPEAQVIATVREQAFREQFINDDVPTLASNPPYYRGPKKNLVIVLEESLGARFVGALNPQAEHDSITPALDALYQQGWGFDNLYATGTRSVRGIEAVISGYLPSPSRSVVKLSKSQKQFFTLAELLQREGYSTQFIYGGESHFDNMKSFFLGNGFHDIVDANDIKSPQFVASWGASDEDLFMQADQELNQLAQRQQPFFSLIFTSSNHDPFDIPVDKVRLPDGYQTDNAARDLAISYADFALGKFISTAQQSDYWKNTIFLVVADHDVRVYGSEPVPIKSFHIPALILNADIAPRRDARLSSQIDLPVTLLSLMGIEAATPMVGRDLTKQYPNERAMMQYYDNYAYIENDRVAILQPGDKVSYWQYDKTARVQTPLSADSAITEVRQQLAQKALAHALFSVLAYQQQRYHLVAQ